MARSHASSCGRFVVVDDLHIDRDVFAQLERWASQRGLTLQDAIQLAICLFDEERATLPSVRKSRDDVERASSPALR